MEDIQEARTKEEIKRQIGKRVEEIRKNMHMSKEQFAKLIGMKGQYLGTVEKGQKNLTVEKVISICEKTGVSADYILLGKTSNIEENFKEMLSDFNEQQIKSAFQAISNVALFIKDNN